MQAIILTYEQFDSINQKLESILSKVQSQKTEEPEWLNTKEALKLLNIGQTTLWSYRNQGLIKASKINKKLYFHKKDIVKLLSSQQH
jgi:hypothetical protein